MKNVINKLKSNSLFIFILGGIVFGSIGIYGANIYESNEVEYTPTDSNWNVNTVNDAINSLYSMKEELDDLKSTGNATSVNILTGKTAVVQGSTITGTMTDRGAWTNTPISSGKVTIPAGYHNGSGYVDTSTLYDEAITNNKPVQVSGSFTFEGPGDNEVETDSITLPTSGYSTLKVTTSNYPAGRISFSVSSSTGTKSLAHNGTVTIDVSNDNAVTFSCTTDVTCAGSYVLTP